MRYVIDLPSPDFELMLDGLRSACVHKAAYGASILVRYGRTSQRYRDIKAEADRLDRVIEILEEARNHAVPERAVQISETYARNAGDEQGLVYGRPRNDPRGALGSAVYRQQRGRGED